MSSSHQHFQKSKKDPSDEPFNFDDYLNEKGHEEFLNDEPEEVKPSSNYLKNGILLTIILIAFVAWANNLSKNSDWLSVFGFGDSEEISEAPSVINIPPINIDIPEIDIDIPEINVGTNNDNLGSIVEYLQELQAQGLLDNEISAFEARQVYNAGVPINYLLELHQRDLLGELSFVEISEFYGNKVSFEYLQLVKDRGYEGRLSFVDITNYYQNEVPFDYLDLMDEAGYLDDLSFVHITEYYKNGVTPVFLDELKESGLYNSLSFIDVVEIFKSQN